MTFQKLLRNPQVAKPTRSEICNGKRDRHSREMSIRLRFRQSDRFVSNCWINMYLAFQGSILDIPTGNAKIADLNKLLIYKLNNLTIFQFGKYVDKKRHQILNLSINHAIAFAACNCSSSTVCRLGCKALAAAVAATKHWFYRWK